MAKRRTKPDNVWRLIYRGKPQGIGPDIDGRDCYWFERAGGTRPTDVSTTCIMLVDRFWRREHGQPAG